MHLLSFAHSLAIASATSATEILRANNLVLIQGKDDAVVLVVQSRVMADALKDQGKTHEYVELENGTHNLDYLPDRQQTFEAMENFLKKYLPSSG